MQTCLSKQSAPCLSTRLDRRLGWQCTGTTILTFPTTWLGQERIVTGWYSAIIWERLFCFHLRGWNNCSLYRPKSFPSWHKHLQRLLRLHCVSFRQKPEWACGGTILWKSDWGSCWCLWWNYNCYNRWKSSIQDGKAQPCICYCRFCGARQVQVLTTLPSRRQYTAQLFQFFAQVYLGWSL